ncbi:MAG: DMT family transporter, partial [bacterium]|nr:DMT family transporter [bacterium]
MGIIFALIALFSWGIGDFLIQRSARKFGNWISIFYITTFASVALFPFVYKELAPLLWNKNGLIILLLASVFLTFASYFDFEALRIGKISVIEPIFVFEIAVTAILSTFFIKEHLNILQIILIIAVMAGIFLVSTKSFQQLKNIKWEEGVIIAIMASIGTGIASFLFGVGARDTSPLLINWFTSFFLAVVSFSFLVSKSQA